MNIYKFLKGLEPNINGHLLKDIWKFSDREINAEHNFIQVLFPLDEPVTEPPQRLEAALKAQGLSPDFFRSPKPGEVLSLSK
jgi:hypothetical protein